jgi:membrane-bound lytic murein transglycosylase D
MPVRNPLLAALCLAGIFLTLRVPPTHAQSAPTALLAAPSDTGTTAGNSSVLTAREAYQAAWTQRQAGDPAAALSVLDPAMAEVDKVLQSSPDASVHRELADLRSRMDGLRSAIQGDIESKLESKPDSKKEPAKAGESDDHPVLDAPAVEDIEPQLNADVYRYIEFFTGNGRSTFERWLKRSGRYMGLFREALKREGMPPDLVHLVFVESGFNVHARSVSNAVGPWQFLRSTGKLWGLTVNQWVDERKDPEKATVAAARYLRHLYTIFGDWPLALASYNAGEGTVLRAIKKQGTTNYWDLRLPRQTEEYVPQFMAVLAITRDPEKYGFDSVELEEPMNFDELALKGSVDLRAVAKLAGCSFDQLKALNPAVLRHAAPGKDGVTMVRVPHGTAEQVIAALQGGVAIPAVDLTVKHTVRRGETLQKIANQYNIDATKLAKDNGVSRSRPLRRGAVLTIRSSMKKQSVQVADLEPDDPRARTAYVPPRKIGTPARIDGNSEADGRATVTVRRGESLSKVAERANTTLDDLMRTNKLKTSKVRPGTRLKVRDADAMASAAVQATTDSAKVATLKAPKGRKGKSGGSSAGTIRVKPGDTLSTIAARHGTTVTRLKRANGMSSNTVRTGQRLRLPA